MRTSARTGNPSRGRVCGPRKPGNRKTCPGWSPRTCRIPSRTRNRRCRACRTGLGAERVDGHDLFRQRTDVMCRRVGLALSRVGPHGYIHGWIFVGVPAVGARVEHPQHGHGTVTGHNGMHATVTFDKTGAVHTFPAHTGVGARLERAPADPAGTLRGYYGDKFTSDGSDWADRHAKDLTRIFPPEIHKILAKNGARFTLGEGPVEPVPAGPERCSPARLGRSDMGRRGRCQQRQ